MKETKKKCGCGAVSGSTVVAILEGRCRYEKRATLYWRTGFVGASHELAEYSAMWNSFMLPIQERVKLEDEMDEPCVCHQWKAGTNVIDVLLKEQYIEVVRQICGGEMTYGLLMQLPLEVVHWERISLVRRQGEVLHFSPGADQTLVGDFQRLLETGTGATVATRVSLDTLMADYSYLHLVLPQHRQQVALVYGGDVSVERLFSTINHDWIDWHALHSLRATPVADHSAAVELVRVCGAAWLAAKASAFHGISVVIRGEERDVAPVMVALKPGQSFVSSGELQVWSGDPVYVYFGPEVILECDGVHMRSTDEGIRVLVEGYARFHVEVATNSLHDDYGLLSHGHRFKVPIWVQLLEAHDADRVLHKAGRRNVREDPYEGCSVILLSDNTSRQFDAPVKLDFVRDLSGQDQYAQVCTDPENVLVEFSGTVAQVYEAGLNFRGGVTVMGTYKGQLGVEGSHGVLHPAHFVLRRRVVFDDDCGDMIDPGDSWCGQLMAYIAGRLQLPDQWMPYIKNGPDLARVYFGSEFTMAQFLAMHAAAIELDVLWSTPLTYRYGRFVLGGDSGDVVSWAAVARAYGAQASYDDVKSLHWVALNRRGIGDDVVLCVSVTTPIDVMKKA